MALSQQSSGSRVGLSLCLASPPTGSGLVDVVCASCTPCPCCRSQSLTLMSFMCPPLKKGWSASLGAPKEWDYIFLAPTSCWSLPRVCRHSTAFREGFLPDNPTSQGSFQYNNSSNHCGESLSKSQDLLEYRSQRIGSQSSAPE